MSTEVTTSTNPYCSRSDAELLSTQRDRFAVLMAYMRSAESAADVGHEPPDISRISDAVLLYSLDRYHAGAEGDDIVPFLGRTFFLPQGGSQSQYQVLELLLAGTANRTAVDNAAGRRNGPDVIARLRHKHGLQIPVLRRYAKDAFGTTTSTSTYSLTQEDRLTAMRLVRVHALRSLVRQWWLMSDERRCALCDATCTQYRDLVDLTCKEAA